MGGIPVDKSLIFIQEIANNIKLTVNKPVISGPSQLCDEDNYYIDGLPSGATVTWSYGSSNHPLPIPLKFTVKSGQGTPSVVLKRASNLVVENHPYVNSDLLEQDIIYAAQLSNSNNFNVVIKQYTGIATIKAVIVYQSETITITRDIQVGLTTPVIGLYNSNHQQVAQQYTNTPYTFNVIGLNEYQDNNAYFDWEVAIVNPTGYPTWILGMREMSFNLLKKANYSQQRVRAKVRYSTNNCGRSNWGTRTLNFADNNFYVLSYINPTSNIVDISVYEKIEYTDTDVITPQTHSLYQGIYELQIWNDYGLQRTIQSNTPTTSVSLSSLMKGYYYVKLIINRQIVSTSQMIVN